MRWARRLSFGLILAIAAFPACVGDETPEGDDPDAGTGGPTKDATTDSFNPTPVPDGNAPPGDATVDATSDADAATPDAGDATVDAPSDGTVESGPDADAAPDVIIVDAAPDGATDGGGGAEKVAAAYAPWAVALSATHVYWTEGTFLGAPAATVRRCSLATGCATVPAAIYSASAGSAAPLGIAVVNVGGVDTVFYADNQVPNEGLWRMLGDGSGRARWSSVQSNGAGVVTDGTSLIWGNPGGAYRSPVTSDAGTPPSPLVLAGDLAGTVENGPHSIALNSTDFFAAPGGKQVRSCPKGAVCDGDAGSTNPDVVANEPAGVRAIAADDTYVFFTDAATYKVGVKERLLRCPVGGCPGGSPIVFAQTGPGDGKGGGTHLGIAVDGKNVYWSTLEGTIYYCATGATAPCSPTALVTGAQARGFAQTATHLYWADARGGIYRIAKP